MENGHGKMGNEAGKAKYGKGMGSYSSAQRWDSKASHSGSMAGYKEPAKSSEAGSHGIPQGNKAYGSIKGY